MVRAHLGFKPSPGTWFEGKEKLGGHHIPSVTKKLVKNLGKVFNGSLNKSPSRQLVLIWREWGSTLDKSGLPGGFMTWICQHGILSRILWSLLSY